MLYNVMCVTVRLDKITAFVEHCHDRDNKQMRISGRERK